LAEGGTQRRGQAAEAGVGLGGGVKERFKICNFKPESLGVIEQCNEIISDYLGQGLRLTLRQLYYQMVVRNAIRNLERSYKNLSKLLSDARLAGLVDWDAIEDRLRLPRVPQEFANLRELVQAAIDSFKLPR
jgi:hypothetical protein